MASDVGISWTYDEKSQLTNSIIGFDYIYDTSSIHYGELEYKYAYDPNGNVKDVEIDAAGSVEGDISNSNYVLGRYNTRIIKFGSGSSRTFTNTVNVEYGSRGTNGMYDTGLIESYSTKVNSNTATTYTYTYDVRGNITRIVDNTGKVTKYYYDDIGQLTREDNPYLNKSYSYTYDKNGNRISKSTYQYTTAATLPSDYQSYEYWQYGNDDWGDQLTSYSGTPITYDEIGNPLTYSNYEFEWENGRQLKKITVGLGMSVYEYTYNDEGIRTSKKVTGTTHYYTLNGSQILTEQFGNIFIVYLYDESGSPIGMQYRTKSMAEGAFYTYLFEKNLQGDIIAVYNTSGTKLVSYVYDAWGNVTATNHNVSGTNSGARHNPFRYRGYYYDTETGYYYLQSRYYNPEWGRFLNADGQINEGLIGGNLYVYCANNPVMFVDPDGNIPKWFAATLAIGVGLVTIAAVASMLPAAACFAGFAASMYIGSAAAAVATTATYVAGTAVAISAGAYMADSIYNYYTDETVLLDTVFQGNVDAYQTGAMLTSVGTFGISQMASMGNQLGICFVAGTLVETENGSVPIEEITAGMLVYAHNPDTGETELKEVVQTFVRETSELVHIKVNGEEIITTPTHPFWVPQKGWTDAIQLRAGDRLQLLNGEYVIIEQVQHEILEAPVTVYNFEVEGFHTYFVGETSVLVHNDCKPTSQNQMQKQVERGQAPKEVDRVDPPHLKGQQPHIHFKDGTSMNMDGTIHDAFKGTPKITNKIQIWLDKNNWGKK